MMGPFEIATKAAIKELLEKHTQPSKFGAFISSTAEAGLIEDIYALLLNSRQLKTLGDKVLAGQLPQPKRQGKTVASVK